MPYKCAQNIQTPGSPVCHARPSCPKPVIWKTQFSSGSDPHFVNDCPWPSGDFPTQQTGVRDRPCGKNHPRAEVPRVGTNVSLQGDDKNMCPSKLGWPWNVRPKQVPILSRAPCAPCACTGMPQPRADPKVVVMCGFPGEINLKRAPSKTHTAHTDTNTSTQIHKWAVPQVPEGSGLARWLQPECRQVCAGSFQTRLAF